MDDPGTSKASSGPEGPSKGAPHAAGGSPSAARRGAGWVVTLWLAATVALLLADGDGTSATLPAVPGLHALVSTLVLYLSSSSAGGGGGRQAGVRLLMVAPSVAALALGQACRAMESGMGGQEGHQYAQVRTAADEHIRALACPPSPYMERSHPPPLQTRTGCATGAQLANCMSSVVAMVATRMHARMQRPLH